MKDSGGCVGCIVWIGLAALLLAIGSWVMGGCSPQSACDAGFWSECGR